MIEFSDDDLSAFLDGAADERLAAVIEARLAGDPVLAERVAHIRSNDDLLREAFAAELAAKPFAMPEAQASNNARHLPSWWRMAAVIAVAALAGWTVAQLSANQGRDVMLAADGLVARSDLARGLSQAGSARPYHVANSVLTITLSFRSDAGTPCRQFRLETGSRAAMAVACRKDGDWHVVGWLGESAPRSAGGYHVAAGDDDPRVEAILDRLGVNAMNASQEEAAIRDGWK